MSAALETVAIGFAAPCPAIPGALPWTGSYMPKRP